MNHILYNFAIIMLGFGIILMTQYITKVSNNSFMTQEQILLNKQNGLRRRASEIDIYNYRISKEYNNMFLQPSVLLGYQELNPDPNDLIKRK
jgi:hypothetical protein